MNGFLLGHYIARLMIGKTYLVVTVHTFAFKIDLCVVLKSSGIAVACKIDAFGSGCVLTQLICSRSFWF